MWAFYFLIFPPHGAHAERQHTARKGIANEAPALVNGSGHEDLFCRHCFSKALLAQRTGTAVNDFSRTYFWVSDNRMIAIACLDERRSWWRNKRDDDRKWKSILGSSLQVGTLLRVDPAALYSSWLLTVEHRKKWAPFRKTWFWDRAKLTVMVTRSVKR